MFDAALNGQPAAGLRTDKVRALLAYLLVESQSAHPREALAELLWPDQPPDSALHNLRQALSTLRKALGDDAAVDPAQAYLILQKDTIQWNPAADAWVDVHEFQRLAAAAPNLDGRLPIRKLRRAFGLYTAPFLEHFSLPDSSTWEEWALLTREVFNQQAIQAFNRLMEYHERRQEYEQAAQLAAQLLKLAPWDETLHAALMRLHALQGNWSAALAQYAACRRYLKAELDVEPAPATAALFESIRLGAASDHPPAPRFAAARSSLPRPATAFTGRSRELDDLAEHLADPACRLVTLLGPGGIGKTRLAIEAAREQVGVFGDGVFFIPLGAVSDCARLPAAIAEGLGIQLLPRDDPQAQLSSALSEKSVLLVLDTLEQLTGAALCLAELLQAAPRLVILATSRARLNLHEEWVYLLEGLPVPPPGITAWNEILQYPAAELFFNAARRSGHRLSPAPEESAALGQICRLVEGTPLSLELAASASRVRSLAEIAADLSHSMDVLSSELVNLPPRHRSLRATFEHSWALLTAAEKRAFARLGIFSGFFNLEAARAVTGMEPHSLVEKFLVKRDETGLFWLHASLRQFALEKLQNSPADEADAAARHAAYYAEFLSAHESALESMRQAGTLEDIARFAGEFARAWQFAALHGQVDLLEKSLAALYLFFDLRSRYKEGIDLFNEALNALPAADTLHARILTRVGVLSNRIGRHEDALRAVQAAWQVLKDTTWIDDQLFCLIWLANLTRQSKNQSEARLLAEQALQLARQNERPRSISSALYILSFTKSNAGEYEQARQHLEESLAVARQLDMPRLLIAPLNALADIDCYVGDYPSAIEIYGECLQISRQLGDRFNEAMQYNNMGTVHHYLKEYPRADELYQRSLALCQEIGDENGVSVALSNLGELACQAGDTLRAETYFKRGLEIARKTNDTWSILASLNNLGAAYTSLGRMDAARQALLEGLEIGLRAELVPRQLQSLVLLGEWLEKSQQPAKACLLARVALADPALEDGLHAQAQAVIDRCGDLNGVPLPATAEIITRILAGEYV